MNTFPKNFKTCFDVLTSRDRGWLEYSLAAAIVSGGRVLSVGMNKQKFNSIIDVFKTNEWSNIHAEVDAILRVRNKIDLTGSKIYVARMTVYASGWRVGHAPKTLVCMAGSRYNWSRQHADQRNFGSSFANGHHNRRSVRGETL